VKRGATADGLTAPRFETQDSLYDTAWSETNENQIVAASGDGSVKLYDISLDQFPVQSWQEHKREVYSTCWNQVSKDTFCSSSWDGTIKVVSGSCPPFNSAEVWVPAFLPLSAASVLTSHPVVTSTSNVNPHPAHALLHLQLRLLPTLAFRNLLRNIRFSPSNLRPAYPRLSLEPPSPLNPHPRPSTNPPQPDTFLPTLRMPDARLEQVPKHNNCNRWCRHRDPHFRHPQPERRPHGADAGTRVCRP